MNALRRRKRFPGERLAMVAVVWNQGARAAYSGKVMAIQNGLTQPLAKGLERKFIFFPALRPPFYRGKLFSGRQFLDQ